MEHVLIAFLSLAVIYLLNSKVIVLRTSVRIRVSRPAPRLHVQKVSGLSGERRTAGKIPGEESRAAVRSIRQHEDVTKVLDAAKESAEADLSSALINLGCEGKKAKAVARQAMGQGQDFDARLKWALQNAA